MDELVAQVAAWVARERVPPDGEPVVVACSGGGDSTALLLALAELGRWRLHAVYVDHGLRAGTDLEAARVAELAARVGASGERIAVSVEPRGNRMAQARVARYRGLAEVARRRRARFLAVAHSATDQAETVVFRSERGDPAQALSGIPARRVLDGEVEIVRPMLEVSRSDAAAFVAARGVVPVEDPTNARTSYTRNAIRARLAPAREMEASLCDLARRTAETNRGLDQQALSLGPLDALPAETVAAAGSDVALRLLRRAGLHRAGQAHARALLDLAAGSAGSRRIDLGDGLVAERRYRMLSIGRPEAGDAGDFAIAVPGPGRYRFPGGELILGDGPGDAIDLRFPALLRNLRPGDRFRTAAGGKKLADLLIDRKVPRPLRRRLPILATADRLLWVAGLGVSRDALPSPGAPALRLSLRVDSPLTCAIMRLDSRREVARLADERE